MLNAKTLGRFRSDERGLAALEFAIIAPFMVMLYMGLAELTLAMMAERRASHAASVVGDLVTQSSQMNTATITDIFNVGDAVLRPFPTATLKMRVTSVKADAAAVPKVVWSRGDGMTALGAATTASAVPANLLLAGDSVVMTEVSYTWTSPLQEVVPLPRTFSQTYFFKPRKSPEVAWMG
ncbi:TadE/TadG family type IV pilus assembly protein [Phenylobacterium sp. J367]|uniref:TadE/TadG family type IV pilus assembly protein n=1 Tax=Phenylobacterium sp. J367 TaxID=2898435 RepID=UPI0021512B5F|nr:TadE/TadG family type IV pilus assembly protein [Phenylobacterium sp. J367]MCR5877720.1 pilus assembly protein [Phenylobacterium sp. J367]